MKDAGGKFIGYGVGDVSSECVLVNHRLLAAYPAASHAREHGVVESSTFTQATKLALIDLTTFMNGNAASQVSARGRGAKFPLRTDGVADLNVRKAIGAYIPPPPPEPSCVVLSVNGAGSTWNMGYPFDIGETLDKSRCWHQPIGYDTTPFPMQRGVKTGVEEVIRQLFLPRGARGLNCTQLPYAGIAYSMGSIVWCQVLQRIMDGDLQQFKHTYMGSVSYGNPMREENHAFPGGIPVDGAGIVTPTLHDTPDAHWDFTSQRGMVGATGDDLYAKVGGDDNSVLSVEDIRAVWKIVNSGNPLTLAAQILKLVSSPSFSEIEGAFDAAWSAAQFFIFKGLSPHTTYQFLQPKAGDGRDSWELGRAYIADLVARQPRAFP